MTLRLEEGALLGSLGALMLTEGQRLGLASKLDLGAGARCLLLVSVSVGCVLLGGKPQGEEGLGCGPPSSSVL